MWRPLCAGAVSALGRAVRSRMAVNQRSIMVQIVVRTQRGDRWYRVRLCHQRGVSDTAFIEVRDRRYWFSHPFPVNEWCENILSYSFVNRT